MGETHRLDDGTSQIDISPVRGYNEPDNRIRETLRVEGGLTTTHEYGSKRMYELPLNNITEAEADVLIDWWQSMTTLTLTVDLAGGSEYSLEIKITDLERPVQMWGGDWDTLFAGQLTLHEHSSISFSSSSQSVSGSKSCSESYSESWSSGSSRASCSESVWVSRSSMSSKSGSQSDSESCSAQPILASCSTGSSASCSSSTDGGESCSTSDIESCSTSASESCSTSGSDSDSLSQGVEDVTLGSTSCSWSTASSGSKSESQSCSVSGAG